MTWYYKTNSKVNLLRLKTKVDEPYPHSFKYFNYKEDYIVNDNKYSF